MMNAYLRNSLYILSFTPAVAVVLGNLNGGVFTLTNFIYSLVCLGLVEWITPASSSPHHTPKQDFMPKLILLLHVPAQLLALCSLFYGIYIQSISGYWILTAAFSTGLNSGSSAIVVSHELIHCKDKIEQWFGKFLLFTAGNVYFFIEHLKVHHKWVGTDKDHATAKYGESLYQFFIRSVKGQTIGAFNMETTRLKALNKPAISFANFVVVQIALQIIVAILILFIAGPLFLLAWLIQCLVANFLLEYVNYIQHYGLMRNEKQRVTEEYSWESNQFVSRFVLVDLSRHADHHYYASKPYHTLVGYEASPKLPSGYAGLFFIAAVPFLWKKVMHGRIRKLKQSGLTAYEIELRE